MKVDPRGADGQPLRVKLSFRGGRPPEEGILRSLVPCRGGFKFSLRAPGGKPVHFTSEDLSFLTNTTTGEIYEPAQAWLRGLWLNEVEAENGGIPLAHAIASLGLDLIGPGRSEELARCFGYWATLWDTVNAAQRELKEWTGRQPELSRERIIMMFADPAFGYVEQLFRGDTPTDKDMPALSSLLGCFDIGANSAYSLLEYDNQPDTTDALSALQHRSILPHPLFTGAWR